MSYKTGLVLEGGALRGIFTAGVLDTLLEKDMYFPYISGVSVGVSNASGFASRQIGRSKRVLMHEGHPAFYGLPSILRSGKMVNLKECINTYAHEYYPYDFKKYHEGDSRWEVVVVNCETGQPEYIETSEDDELTLEYCQASCSLPFICSPKEIDGKKYMDGSLADSIPFQRAFDMGCEKVVVIMTKAEIHEATDYKKMKAMINMFYGRKYPKLAETIISRKERYTEQMAQMEILEKEGKLMILRPDETMVGHFEQSRKKLEAYYQHGREYMLRRFDELKEFMGE